MRDERTIPEPPLWFMQQDRKTAQRHSSLIPHVGALGVRNRWEMLEAEVQLGRDNLNLHWSWMDVPIPSRFLRLHLAMPEKPFAPDFLSWEGYKFCSQRLREVLNQPEEVVQFVPINIVSGNEPARAQHYTWMRVLAEQNAFDIEKSRCEREVFPNTLNGMTRPLIGYCEQYAFLDDISPQTEIFRPFETLGRLLVTPSLARRVLQAGCTGVEFEDPTNRQDDPDEPNRYLTAKGIVKRRLLSHGQT